MYDGVAKFYDRYTADIQYEKIADFAENCFRLYGNPGIAETAGNKKTRSKKAVPPNTSSRQNGEDVPYSTLVLDCACGTGTLTCLLAKRGYDMTGVDISREMLQTASENAAESGLDILWLCQDMRKINMYGSYAAVLCMTDGINHLTTEKQLEAFFGRIYNFIDDGGLLIFDFLTPYHFEKNVGNNIFFEDDENGSCLWTSSYQQKTGICVYDILLYECLEEDPSLYTRTEDRVREKAWPPEYIAETLRKKGFELCGLYDGFSFSPAAPDTARVYAVARKPKTMAETEK